MSSSTSLEFGLIETLRTGNFMLDTLICMCIPLLIQRIFSHLENTPVWISKLFSPFLHKPQTIYVERVVETSESFNSYGRLFRDEGEKNKMLQKALSLHIADVIDMNNQNAMYELQNKVKKSSKSESEEESTADTESISSDASDSSQEIERLVVESFPLPDKWVDLVEGIQFLHTSKRPNDKDEDDKDSSTIKKTKTSFFFRSKAENGTQHIDDFIEEAFEKYQENERRKWTEDTSRYFYIQEPLPFSLNENNNKKSKIKYKRYELGEEKTFDNLFFSEKEPLVRLLDNFVERRGKFGIKGFPYKLGLLLHGPPGTGKTSVIKAVAQHTGRHVVTIDLGRIETNQQLMDALFDHEFSVRDMDYPIKMDFEDVIFVMEDIDCASSVVNARTKKKDPWAQEVSVDKTTKSTASTKEEAEAKEGDGLLTAIARMGHSDKMSKSMEDDQLNLSGLLNVLDGVIDCPGRIVIMTTNHPEKLDPALIRPGRVNKKLFLGYMDAVETQQMFEYFFQTSFSDHQRKRVEEIYSTTSKGFTPAEIEELCAEFEEVDDAIARLAYWASAY